MYIGLYGVDYVMVFNAYKHTSVNKPNNVKTYYLDLAPVKKKKTCMLDFP